MKELFGIMGLIGVIFLSGTVVAEEGQPAPMANQMVAPQDAPAAPATPAEEAPAVEGVPAAVEEGTAEGTAPEEEVPVGEELKYSFGTVVSVANNQLTILEYDDDMEKEIEVVYNANEQTQYKNINALSELAKDDSVEIFYNEKDSKRMASQIIKEVLTQDTEENQ